MSFISWYGTCEDSCSRVAEVNKSNKLNVLSPFFLRLALPVPLKSWHHWNALLMPSTTVSRVKNRKRKQVKEVLLNHKKLPKHAQLHPEFQQPENRTAKLFGCKILWCMLPHIRERGFYLATDHISWCQENWKDREWKNSRYTWSFIISNNRFFKM